MLTVEIDHKWKILSNTVVQECLAFRFLTEDGEWARVTFEHLDSIRVSLGEYDPYPRDWKPGEQLHWVSEVVPSPWLRERYEYEKSHYGQAYEFNADVDEMLRDFSHYVFSFHDQFVEALSTGIWFEQVDESSDSEKVSATHLFQFALVVDTAQRISWTLAVRARHGQVRSSLRPSLGPVRATFEGVASLDQVRPYVESWLREVKERRKRMGKA